MINIRHATLQDRSSWHQMRCDLWPDGDAEEHASEIDDFFAGRLTEPLAVLIATDDAGQAAGFAELSVRRYAEDCATDHVAYLEGWYVVPQARRTGAGRALVEAAEAWAVELGCTEFASDALIDNAVSFAAHRALGFVETEQIRCFKKMLTRVSSSPPAMDAVARSGDILVRHARMSDAEAIAHLVTELGYTTSPAQMRARLEAMLPKPEYSTLVAVVNAQVAGLIGTMVRPSYEADDLYAQIMALVISTEFRRRGIGRALLRAVERSLARRDVTIVVVNTATHRNDAHAFYETNGYRFTGRRYRKALE